MRRAATIVLLLLLLGCSDAREPAPVATSPSPTTSPPRPPSRSPRPRARPAFREFRVPAGSRPHDVAPAREGGIWYTAQGSGEVGLLRPNGRVREVDLGSGSAPHGVIVGPDGAAWVTDGGRNSIIRVEPGTFRLREFPLPDDRPDANVNTAAFDGDGILWFTGQAGIYGRLEPRSGRMRVFDAPRGFGPYGIAATPDGTVWYSSLAGSYIARIRDRSGRLEVVDTPTEGAGARRVWSDSRGMLWVTEWYAGKLARYDPTRGRWREWDVPGSSPMPYAVYVDERDDVWVTDFGANALWRFRDGRFRRFPFPSAGAEVRQLLGRAGEVWGAESGTDTLVVLRT